jgi:hypothetical protein
MFYSKYLDGVKEGFAFKLMNGVSFKIFLCMREI